MMKLATRVLSLPQPSRGYFLSPQYHPFNYIKQLPYQAGGNTTIVGIGSATCFRPKDTVIMGWFWDTCQPLGVHFMDKKNSSFVLVGTVIAIWTRQPLIP
jgi:hypothetical protein